jgi:hypothetical protein
MQKEEFCCVLKKKDVEEDFFAFYFSKQITYKITIFIVIIIISFNLIYQ